MENIEKNKTFPHAPISAVIIGLNEEHDLPDCLKSLKGISNDLLAEIIYVDSGSTDRSRDIAQEMGVNILKIDNKKKSPGYARNCGLIAVHTPLVLFLDGDMTLEHDFLPRAFAAFNEETIACVCGPIKEKNPFRNIYHRGLSVSWREQKIGKAVTPSGGGLFRTKALNEAGAYNPDIPAGEEVELKNRLVAKGWQLIAIDTPMASHDLNMNSLGELMKRGVREGRLQAYSLSHPELPFLSKYAKLAKQNIILAFTIPLVAGLLFWSRSWLMTAGIALTGMLLFLLRFYGQIVRSSDPYGYLLNFLFIYGKKPAQMYGLLLSSFQKVLHRE